MKLARYGQPGAETGTCRSRRQTPRSVTSLRISRRNNYLMSPWPNSPKSIPPRSRWYPAIRDWACPLRFVSKYIAIGLNYTDHAEETKLRAPKEPIVFMKAVSCLWPERRHHPCRSIPKADWEVGLGIVISESAVHR